MERSRDLPMLTKSQKDLIEDGLKNPKWEIQNRKNLLPAEKKFRQKRFHIFLHGKEKLKRGKDNRMKKTEILGKILI